MVKAVNCAERHNHFLSSHGLQPCLFLGGKHVFFLSSHSDSLDEDDEEDDDEDDDDDDELHDFLSPHGFFGFLSQ